MNVETERQNLETILNSSDDLKNLDEVLNELAEIYSASPKATKKSLHAKVAYALSKADRHHLIEYENNGKIKNIKPLIALVKDYYKNDFVFNLDTESTLTLLSTAPVFIDGVAFAFLIRNIPNRFITQKNNRNSQKNRQPTKTYFIEELNKAEIIDILKSTKDKTFGNALHVIQQSLILRNDDMDPVSSLRNIRSHITQTLRIADRKNSSEPDIALFTDLLKSSYRGHIKFSKSHFLEDEIRQLFNVRSSVRLKQAFYALIKSIPAEDQRKWFRKNTGQIKRPTSLKDPSPREIRDMNRVKELTASSQGYKLFFMDRTEQFREDYQSGLNAVGLETEQLTKHIEGLPTQTTITKAWLEEAKRIKKQQTALLSKATSIKITDEEMLETHKEKLVSLIGELQNLNDQVYRREILLAKIKRNTALNLVPDSTDTDQAKATIGTGKKDPQEQHIQRYTITEQSRTGA